MKITFHPRRLWLAVVAFVTLGALLSLATDVGRAGLVGLFALGAYLLVEVFFTVNPAAWWGDRR